MTWLTKLASDEARVTRNIARLEELRKSVHELAYYAVASQSGGFKVLQNLLESKVVLGRPNIHEKMKEALIGENNQKIALDAPTRFQRLMLEVEDKVNIEIGKERITLRQLNG